MKKICSLLSVLAILICASPLLAKEGILLVSFGTSQPDALKTYALIEEAYKKAFPDAVICDAFTSEKIRAKLSAQGKKMNSIAEGLAELASKGADDIRIQSLHIFPGEEFEQLGREALAHVLSRPEQFRSVRLARPLLDSADDGRRLVSLLKEDGKKDDCVAYMAHGNSRGIAGLALEGVHALFEPPMFVASVEGDRDYEVLEKELRANNCRRVNLTPLMLVAGEHARNDLAGPEPDSWASRLKDAGFEVNADLTGLGERPEVVRMFIEHTNDREKLGSMSE